MVNCEQGLTLEGLDGSNPLGFLAAVGVLRTTANADPDGGWRMRWVMRDGWRPELAAERHVSRTDLVDLLMSELQRDSNPEFAFAKNLKVTPDEFLEVASDAQRTASREGRRHADFVAAFGCEVLSTDDGVIQDTALRTMSGAGHQHFLSTMQELVGKTDVDHLSRSLFEPWDYSDERLGLRWDPEEDRRFALRWDDPSGQATNTMHGANRLAVEALPLLPTVPIRRRLETTGFATVGTSALFTWPIWVRRLSVDVVRSLLAAALVQQLQPDRASLLAIGVSEVFRSQRLTTGKFRNFTHARPA